MESWRVGKAHVVVIGMFLTNSESFRSPMVLSVQRADTRRVWEESQHPEGGGRGGMAAC